MSKILKLLQTTSTIKTCLADDIPSIGSVLFIEPPRSVAAAAKDEIMRDEQTASTDGVKRPENQAAMLNKWNYTLIVNTAHDPADKSKIFESVKELESIFTIEDAAGIPRHGDDLFDALLAGAHEVMGMGKTGSDSEVESEVDEQKKS